MKPLSHSFVFLYGSLFVAIVVLFCACGSGDEKNRGFVDAQLPPSFSFFDVGVNTSYSRNLRNSLQEVLGDDAISSRNTIDLQINTDGFLADHFPALNELSIAFNTPLGERVEHDTTKLTYRYSMKKGLPFDYVELLFSKFSGMPMVIRVFFGQDQLNVLSSLKEKYGAPKEFAWKAQNGKSLCWEKNGDVLFYSFVPNQFGVPEYQVSIYFTRRLHTLLEREEQKEKGEGAEKQVRSTGKAAF